MGRLLRSVVAICTVAVLMVLGWQCVGLYLEGNSPANLDANGVHLTPVYSAEKVGARLRPLAPALLGYAALVIAALAVPTADGRKMDAGAAPEVRLRLLKARVAQLPASARTEERRRRMAYTGAAAIVLICLAFCLAYLLDGGNFVSWDLETVMGRMLAHVVPWVAAAFAAITAAVVYGGHSMEKELDALKGAEKAAPQKEAAAERRGSVQAVRWALYAVAAVFVALGVMNGGLRDVLVKAINICTECIGLG